MGHLTEFRDYLVPLQVKYSYKSLILSLKSLARHLLSVTRYTLSATHNACGQLHFFYTCQQNSPEPQKWTNFQNNEPGSHNEVIILAIFWSFLSRKRRKIAYFFHLGSMSVFLGECGTRFLNSRS